MEKAHTVLVAPVARLLQAYPALPCDARDAAVVYCGGHSLVFDGVRAFEAHGFIWGGRWYHYDTMHFESRPELVAPSASLTGAGGSLRR